ncbi:MAG: histidine phosphatase family protein [Firmicutes bacterium]|nr:histidine phosphatase family protein [Bacillota bacterium]
MARVLLVRHGQTQHNKDGIMQGLLDVPLNDLGRKQARAVARYIEQKYSLDAVYSSQLQRAYATGQAIATAQGCPLYTHTALQELDVGEWSGLTYAASQAAHPEIWKQLEADPYNTQRPGGESFAQLYDRATTWFRDTIEPQAGKTLCIVTHGATMRALLAYALAVDPAAFGIRMSVHNTGISTLEYSRNQKRWRVLSINCTSHLNYIN